MTEQSNPPRDARADLLLMGRFAFRPEAMYVYRPRNDGSGTALKLNLRVDPVLDESGSFVKSVEGGLFLDLAGQVGSVTRNGKDFARFGWQDNAAKVTAKLGLADITQLLVAIREVRYRGKAVPKGLRARQDPKPTEVSLFHKFGKATTAITYQFAEEQSYLRVSKQAGPGAKPVAKNIALSLAEELQFERYLDMALDTFTRAGL